MADNTTLKADRERLYTYAGVPLTYPDPEVLAFVRDRVKTGALLTAPRPRAAQEIYWPGEWMADLPVQVGRLRWPQGASRFAYGFWLASDEQLNAIQQQVRISPFGYDSKPLTMGDGTNALTTELYMLPPRPLTGFPGASSSNRLWLLPLVDDRYWWWWRTARIDVIAGTTGWESLLASLAAGLGVQLHHDGVSPEYLKPHPTFTTRYEYLPPLLDAAARSIGRRVVRKLNGEVWLESPDRAHAIEARNRQKYPDSWCGGDMALQPYLDGDSRMALPEAVHVVHWIVADGKPTNETQDVAVSLEEAKGFRPRLSQARSNYNHRYFHSLASAAYDADNVWTNEEALQLLDRVLVCDWYEWQLAYSDRTLTGIAGWEPDGLNAWVEWWHDGTADGVGTSVYCPPPAEYDELYLTFDGDVAIPPVMPVLDTIVVRNLYVLEQGLSFGIEQNVGLPKYQVVVGTGPGVTSHHYFKYYYDTTHRLGIGDIPGDPGPLSRVTLQGTGPGDGYAGLSVVQTMTADVARGGLAVVGSRYDHATEPFSAYGTWDDGTERRLDVGGGEWGHPDATSFRLWLAPEYDEEPDQGVLVFRSDATGNTFQAIAADAVPLTVRGASGQTADLLRVENSGGATLVRVDNTGLTGIGNDLDPLALLHVRLTDTGVTPTGGDTVIIEATAPQLELISKREIFNSTATIKFLNDSPTTTGRIVYTHSTTPQTTMLQFFVDGNGNKVLQLAPSLSSLHTNSFGVLPSGQEVGTATGGFSVLPASGQATLSCSTGIFLPTFTFRGGEGIGNAEVKLEIDDYGGEQDLEGLVLNSTAVDPWLGGIRMKLDPINNRLILKGLADPLGAFNIQPRFAVDDGVALRNGVTGTNAIGDKFSGGICYEFGGGLSGGELSGGSLPTSDPGVWGALWVDESAGRVIKVSAGSGGEE